MKKFLITGSALVMTMLALGQQKQGKITYTRVTQMQIHLVGAEGMENSLPKSRSENFELNFANNQSLWKQAEKDNDDDVNSGGVQIRMVVAGSDDILFTNFESGKRVEQRELFDKKFIVDDSIRPLKWKMTGETKVILNHNCMKATATQTTRRSQMNVENGKMERKEVEDTSVIVAWFTNDIPVPAGPGEYQGQLPGLILEMDIANGRQTFQATGISDKPDLSAIKEPTGKKHYTRDEFRAEANKMMDEMQKNSGGGMRFRVNN